MALTKLNFGGSQTSLVATNMPTGSVLQVKQETTTSQTTTTEYFICFYWSF